MSSRPSPSTRRRRRWLNAGLPVLGLVIALLPALQPVLSTEITCGYDNAFHLLRGVQIEHLWDHGVLFSRWAPDMAHGFGFPLFVFGSPLTHILQTLFHRLGLVWPGAMNAVFVLGILLGAGSVYWLVRTLHSEQAERNPQAGIAGGLLGATVYAYSPFLAYDVFNRGSLWESFAWAFPPLILLGLHRWSRRRERAFLALGVVAFAGMILSHYPFAALFVPVYGLWVALHALLDRDWRILWRGLALGLLGLAVTAFFWVPPLTERPYIQTERLLGTWVFDYRHNFLSLEHLLALPRRADPKLINDWPPKGLGLVPLVVAFMSWLGVGRLSRAERWRLGLLCLLTVGMALLTLAPSIWLWDRLPFLSYVQFPWRFLGPAAFCLAIMCGSVPYALTGDRPRGYGAVTALLATVVVFANLGWFYPAKCASPDDLTVPGIIRWERLSDTLGTTAKGEYLPTWVEEFPDLTLDDAYAAGPPVARLRESDLPDGVEILDAEYGPISSRLEIATPTPFVARYLAFYYPGWRVRIDGASVPVIPEEKTGLITFAVPVGTHAIEVSFGETPLRLVGDSISVVGAMVLGWVLIRPTHSGLGRPRNSEGRDQSQNPQYLSILFSCVMVVVIAVKLVVDRGELLWRSSRLSDEGKMTNVAQPLHINFDHRAVLLGSSTLPQDVSAATTPEPVLTLYWRAVDPGNGDWQIGLSLVGDDDVRWPLGTRPARWGRTPPPLQEWSAGGYARMDRILDLPAGLAPGTYDVELVLFDRQTTDPVSVINDLGNPVAPSLLLGEMRIAAPHHPPAVASLDLNSAHFSDCGPLRLVGAEVSHDQAVPGELVAVEMAWEALDEMGVPAEVTLSLQSGVGEILRQWSVPPSAPWWPTTRWDVGSRWKGKAEIRLPGTLDSMTYSITVAVDACEAARLALPVVAPKRTWTMPPDFTPTEAVFGDRIRLAGYEVTGGPFSPGDRISLTLAWEAVTEIERAYRVFVHLVDDAGNFVAQNDGVPVGWTRPTPGWAIGEVVVDARPLQLRESVSPGAYEIRVGLYDEAGVRLTTLSGEDALVIRTVQLQP